MKRVILSFLIAGFATHVVAEQKLGRVTNRPIPRFVSIKTDKANVRRGPSKTHRVDWVFKRRDLPVQIIAEYEHWRRIRDFEGVTGWVHYSLLSGVRTVIITDEMVDLHVRPDAKSAVSARVEQNVVARLGQCEVDWCRINAGGYKGWAPKDKFWGVDADELRD